MISLLQDMKKHKTLVMIVAFVICVYVSLSLTGFLSARASDNDNVDYSFARISDSATNYLDHSNVPREGVGPHIFGSTGSVAAGNQYSNAKNDGGLLGAVDTTKQQYIGKISSRGSDYIISYSYDMLDNLYNQMDKDTGDVSEPTKGALGYARYGYLLYDLGMDETTDATENTGLRMIVGIAFMIMYLLSLGVNSFFSLILTILQFANPFRLFRGTTAANGSPLTGWIDSIAAPTDHSGMGYAVYVGVKNLSDKLASFYTRLYNMSFFVVMPIFLALTIFSITVLAGKKSMITNETSTFGKIKAWVVRITFVVLGVPIMFSCYSSTLDYLQEVTATSNAAGTKIIASTFLDFSEWASHDRLGLPSDVELKLDVRDTTISRNGKSGQVNATTSQKVRQYTYKINKHTKAISGLTGGYNITDFNANPDDGNYDTNMMKSSSSVSASYGTVSDVMSLLSRYAKGQTISGPSFESAEASRYSQGDNADALAWQQMMADSQTYDNFGPLAKQQDAAKPTSDDEDENDNGTDDPNTPEDGEDNDDNDNDNNDDDDNNNDDNDNNDNEEEEAEDEQYAYDISGLASPTWTTDSDSEATDAQIVAFNRLTDPSAWKNAKTPSKIAVNPWANGGLNVLGTSSYAEHYGHYNDVTYKGGKNPVEGDKLNSVADECYGLSTMSMYNYLCSEFSADGVNVHYMGKTGQNDFSHYQVVNVGTGAVKWLYLVDALVLMSCLSVVGYFYGLALVLHNCKAMFKIIPSVFTGMLGSLRGIAKSVALMFALIIEVVATILLYYIATEFVAHCTEIIELPFTILISQANSSIQALLSPVILIIGIIAMVGITKKLIDWRQVIVNSATGYTTYLVNKVFGSDVQAPDLSQKSSGFGQRALTVAGGAAMLGMSTGGLSGAGSLAEKLGIGGASTATGTTASDAVGAFGERTGDMTTNVTDGSNATQYSDSYDTSQVNNGNTNSDVGDTNVGDTKTNLDAYGGDNINGDNEMYEGNDAAYMQDDTTEGDNVAMSTRDENSYQNAGKYVNDNANFLSDVHADTDQINQQKSYADNNANSNVNAQTNADTKQAIQDINKSELTAQGNNVIDTLQNIGDYAYSNDADIKTNAAANLQTNYGNAKSIHDNYNNQRANVMNGDTQASAMQGDPRYQASDGDKSTNAMQGDPRYQTSQGNAGSTVPISNTSSAMHGDPRYAMNQRPEDAKKNAADAKKPRRQNNTYGLHETQPTQFDANQNTAIPKDASVNPTNVMDRTVRRVDNMAGHTESPKKVNTEKAKTTGGYTKSTATRPTAMPLYMGLAMNTRRRNDDDSNGNKKKS